MRALRHVSNSWNGFSVMVRRRPPLTLQPLLFGKKQGFFPKKARVSLFAEPLKSLEKEGKTQEKARKIGKRKKQGNRKKQGLEGQGQHKTDHGKKGQGHLVDLSLRMLYFWCGWVFPTAYQQITYGVVSKGFFCGKFCGNFPEILAKGFCRIKFGAKFAFGGEQLGAKFLAKICAKFMGLFCWDVQSKNNSARISARISHGLRRAKSRDRNRESLAI